MKPWLEDSAPRIQGPISLLGAGMQRITITIDDELAQEIDKLAAARGYQNRSETVRDLVRAGMTRRQSHDVPSAECVCDTCRMSMIRRRASCPSGLRTPCRSSTISRLRQCASRSTTTSLPREVAVLEGKAAEVEHFAQQIIAERGVRHGRVNIIPAEIESERHPHGHLAAHVRISIRIR